MCNVLLVKACMRKRLHWLSKGLASASVNLFLQIFWTIEHSVSHRVDLDELCRHEVFNFSFTNISITEWSPFLCFFGFADVLAKVIILFITAHPPYYIL